jgi:hypothetical protein
MMVLFGAQSTAGTTIDYATPVAPYVALVLFGQASGYLLSSSLATASGKLMLARIFLKASVCAMALALAIKLGWAATKPHVGGALMNALLMTASPLQKLPPGPTYLLFFGGAGIGVAGLILVAVANNLYSWLIGALAIVGRASFFIFMLQFCVYLVILPKFFQPMLMHEWLLCFALSVAFLWLSAAAWDRLGGNRLLTLGLRNNQPAKAMDSRGLQS